MKKLVFSFATVALAVASAASHKITFFQPTVVSGTELQPGQYKLELKENKAIIKAGKKQVEATVRTETGDSKFGATSVRYATADGKMRVQEIHLGGTNTKLVFEN